MGPILKRLRSIEPRFEVGDIFPPIEQELGDHRHLFVGRVLNAGAGHRDISHLVAGELVNQDIETGLHNDNIHVYSPLHDIPFDDGYFDAVICNAVLEHVENPEEVVAEFARVIRPCGALYLCVPFMQPEHLDPSDFQRYTVDGLAALVRRNGFDVHEASAMHSVYTTLGWIFVEWLRPFPGWRGWLLRWAILPWVRRKALTSTSQIRSLASAFRVIAERQA
ncbi:MAG TPA: methyltransferase domain-containing protein [Solirubrobacteraceae bacterium]|jgi:SAM-dependent methyltransferase|nr:methyltransferase domain-containing protein [Solirubrobacteraceae bacterium]